MTLVQKLGILCLPDYERAQTGRWSPFYLNCSHLLLPLKMPARNTLMTLIHDTIIYTLRKNPVLAYTQYTCMPIGL